MKKLYINPEFDFVEVQFSADILAMSGENLVNQFGKDDVVESVTQPSSTNPPWEW